MCVQVNSRFTRNPSMWSCMTPIILQWGCYTFRCPIAFRAAIFIFSCFAEFVFIVVEYCCWFSFMFSVCSTLLVAFGCAAHLIPLIQQQTDPLHSLVYPTSRLMLIFCSQEMALSMRLALCDRQHHPLAQSEVEGSPQINLFLCSSANDLENRLLPNDLIVIRNQWVDHGGHVGHQEGAGEPMKHAQQIGYSIQFRMMESDFKFNSESRTTLPPNWQAGRVRPLIWVIYICMER
jgi:hypothetical protein